MPNMHMLFMTFSFLSALNLEMDELHIIHIGTSQYMFGCVLWMLVFEVLQGNSTHNIQLVWRRGQAAYKGKSTQFTNLGTRPSNADLT